jgi:dTMP kinase
MVADRDERSIGEETAERYVHALDEVSALGDLRDRSIFVGPYRRLFTAQCISSFGDWLGFLAVVSLAGAATKSNKDVAVGVVLSARLIPGFFFGAFATSVLDRWDRKRLLVVCDIGRGLTFAVLPFVHTVYGLFLASVLLELLTLMWTPAKEASVPNLVSADKLAAANSASLASAYGTILPAVLFYPALTFVSGLLGHVHGVQYLKAHRDTFAVYLDVLTFFLSAFLISRLPLPRKTDAEKADVAAATPKTMWHDAREGWRYIRRTYRVRAVILGFCTGLIGGGMVVPLGITYSETVLHAGTTGYGLLEMALGIGVAGGVMVVSVWQRRVSHTWAFGWSVAGAGAALLVAASLARLGLVMLAIGVFGACVGSVYVLGFTILGSSTSDEIRGRIFGMFYTLVRLCLLLAFTLAPLFSGLLNGLSDHLTRTVGGRTLHHEIGNATFHVSLPGTRLTLWLGGLIIVAASWVARRDLDRGAAAEERAAAPAADDAESTAPAVTGGASDAAPDGMTHGGGSAAPPDATKGGGEVEVGTPDAPSSGVDPAATAG